MHEFQNDIEKERKGLSFRGSIGFNKVDSRKSRSTVDQIKQGYFKNNEELKESLRQSLYKYSQQITDIQNSKKLMGSSNIIEKKFVVGKRSGASSAQLSLIENKKIKTRANPTYTRKIKGKEVNLIKFKPERAAGARVTETGISARIKGNSGYASEMMVFLDGISKDPTKQQILSLFKIGNIGEIGFKNADKDLVAAFMEDLKSGQLSIEKRTAIKSLMSNYSSQLTDILNVYKEFQKSNPSTAKFVSHKKKSLEDGEDNASVERSKLEQKTNRRLKSVVRSLVFETYGPGSEDKVKEINKSKLKTKQEKVAEKEINIGSSGGGGGDAVSKNSDFETRISNINTRLNSLSNDIIDEIVPLNSSNTFGNHFKLKDENGNNYFFRQHKKDNKVRDGYINSRRFEERAEWAYNASTKLGVYCILPSKKFELSGKLGSIEVDIKDFAINPKNKITGMHSMFNNWGQIVNKDKNIGDKATVEYIVGGTNRTIANTAIEHLDDGGINTIFTHNTLSFPGGGKAIDYPHGLFNTEEFFKSVAGSAAVVSDSLITKVSDFSKNFKDNINYLDGISDSEAEALHTRITHVLNSLEKGKKKKGYATFRDIIG